MNPETKARLSTVLSLIRVSYNYGYIPLIIYFGLKKGADQGMPELTLGRSDINLLNISIIIIGMITSISSSVVSSGMHNRPNTGLNRNGVLTNSLHPNSYTQNNLSLKCTKPVLICIAATVLPVTITFLLILGFIMQKNNLHEYAIYTFVIFCMAFIFPFVLFFFIVILSKIFKFYKRITNSCGGSDSIQEPYRYSTNRNPNDNNFRSALRIDDYEVNNSRHTLNNIPIGSTSLHNIVLIDVSVDQQISSEDDPPTYEMALLCPTVQLMDRKCDLEYN